MGCLQIFFMRPGILVLLSFCCPARADTRPASRIYFGACTATHYSAWQPCGALQGPRTLVPLIPCSPFRRKFPALCYRVGSYSFNPNAVQHTHLLCHTMTRRVKYCRTIIHAAICTQTDEGALAVMLSPACPAPLRRTIAVVETCATGH
jgi:hypothetical protein